MDIIKYDVSFNGVCSKCGSKLVTTGIDGYNAGTTTDPIIICTPCGNKYFTKKGKRAEKLNKLLEEGRPWEKFKNLFR